MTTSSNGSKTATALLVGKYFHTTTCPGGHRVAKWQGEILGEPSPGLLLIQLFNWINGCESGQEFITITDFVAKNPFLYDSAEEMNFSYSHGVMNHRCERNGCRKNGQADS